ncbi:MAG TPA: rhomboid family intramembrane serine protease [Rhodanobacteraceae bacterium]|nr:rhomboid family intramembrane serine protease [Rhodanobacteraceae bacterium]
MFVHLEQRQRRVFPWATLLLVTACVAVFVCLSLTPAAARLRLVLAWGVMPAELLSGTLHPAHLAQLVSTLFIHADWLHLVSNLLFLVIFGLPAERALKWQRYLLLFLTGGACANLMGAVSVADSHAVLVGCSGAVSAVVGAYLALFPRARLGVVLPLGLFFEFVRVPALLLIGVWVLLQFVFTYVGPSFGAVVWWTHIAGFLFGLLFGTLSRPALARRQRRAV